MVWHRARLIADRNCHRSSSREVCELPIAMRMIQTLDHFFNGIFCGGNEVGSEKIRFPFPGEIKQDRLFTIGEFQGFTHFFLIKFGILHHQKQLLGNLILQGTDPREQGKFQILSHGNGNEIKAAG